MSADTFTQCFIIEAVSQHSEPVNPSYRVRTRLNSGVWRTAPTNLTGIYDVRWFLNDSGIDEKRIALAVEELRRSGHVMVSGRSLKAA
jgi:hypothetical protein